MKRGANETAAREGRNGDAPGSKHGGLPSLRTVRAKGLAVAGSLREKLPSRGAARASTTDARTWTSRTMRQHPVGTGLGVLALGFLSASLLPASGLERRAYSRASGKAKDLVDRLDASERIGEVLSAVRQVAADAAAEQLASLRPQADAGGARRKLERLVRKDG
ncbi:hypothetical protein [Comamonas sp. JC664]|uniref:hypothetical protein n=1 Tax=Comamonas sp. JC664 TaxID=2801917 RepID=UPI001E4D3C32|nr:hypothetical protein [Comamonas sp. JC664]